MKRKKKDIMSVSYDEYMIRKLRENSKFVAKYLNAALADTKNPPCCGSRCAALRKPAAELPRWLRLQASSAGICIASCRRGENLGSPRWLP